MKPTKENLKILKKLGFSCDKDKTGNKMDTEWYSLENGWGFRLDAVKDFPELMNRLYFGQVEACTRNGSKFNDGNYVIEVFDSSSDEYLDMQSQRRNEAERKQS